MTLYWKTRSGGCDDEYLSARLGNLVLHVADIDGDNQPYSIELISKTVAFGTKQQQLQTVFSLDPFFGGLKHAKERVTYIANCLHYGLPIEWTEAELAHGEFTPLSDLLQAPPRSQIRDIWIRGIYYLPSTKTYFRAEYVANIDGLQGTNNKRIHLGAPSVVLKEILTGHMFVVNLEEFSKHGFQYHEGIDHYAQKMAEKAKR